MNDFWTWGGWNAVAAIGQILAALASLAALFYAIRLSKSAKDDQKKANWTAMQNSRLMGASLRCLAYAVTPNQQGVMSQSTKDSIRSIEMVVEEIEKGYVRHNE